MKAQRTYFIILCTAAMFLCSAGNIAIAQTNTDKQLALQYFQNEEYDKAAVVYENLFHRSGLDYYYNYYIKCLIELEDFKTAEKVVKKQVKKNPETLSYLVDLGYVYKSNNEDGKSTQSFDKALKLLGPDERKVIKLANAFLGRGEESYSIKTYLKGRKLLRNANSFRYEIAQVYYRSGQNNLMINEYLDLLRESPERKEQVQNLLQSRLFQEVDEKALKHLHGELIKRIQKHPTAVVFGEMLVWYFVQRKDFTGAFNQVTALDRRRNEEGKRLIKLGQLCMESWNYDVAIQCFEYVVSKGVDNRYYIIARRELLAAFNEKIISRDYTVEDLVKLEASYIAAIEELGKSKMTMKIMRDLAHLQAFYLYDTESAVELLEEVIGMAGIQSKERARSKLELADILVLKGLVWDASLYYSQIDKVFKHDPIGHEAKFRNARLFYYTGEFEWAQTQLDVLKASTSKLIANDAMELSLLITDNTIMDTTTEALLLFAKAELKDFQNKHDSALHILSSIVDSFPGHTLTDDVYFMTAKVLTETRKYPEAIGALEHVVKEYPLGILGDDALFMMASIYQNKLDDKEKAMELYERILNDYQGSLYVVESRKRFRNLRGDKLN
jgi:tetratricopeptide (TPR) repeat protein